MATYADSDLNQTNIQFLDCVSNLMRFECFIIHSNKIVENIYKNIFTLHFTHANKSFLRLGVGDSTQLFKDMIFLLHNESDVDL